MHLTYKDKCVCVYVCAYVCACVSVISKKVTHIYTLNEVDLNLQRL